MNRNNLFCIVSMMVLILTSCSKQGLNTSAEIDNIEIEITRTVVNSAAGYSIDSQTQDLGPKIDLLNIYVFAIATVNDVDDIKKINGWDVQLFDEFKQEYKLQRITSSIRDTVEGDKNIYHFEIIWEFGDVKTSDTRSFTLHLPEKNILQIDSLVEVYEYGVKKDND